MLVRCVTVPLLALFLCLHAFAAKEWPVSRGPARDSEHYRYDPSLLKKVPQAFLDDAPACYLRSSTIYTVEEDGTIEMTTHELIRLNSRKAIDQLGEHRSIFFNPSYEKLTLNDTCVHKADGRQVEVEPGHVQLRDTQTDFLVYQTSKQLIISFPNLEVGDVLDVRWTTRGKNPEHEGQFFTNYWFGDEKYPVYQDRFRVRCTRKKKLRFEVINPQLCEGGKLNCQVEKEPGYLTYTWQEANCKPLPQEDHMPSKEEVKAGLVCSTFASWEEVAAWERRTRSSCWECIPELHKVIAGATRGLDTPLAKARALTDWVHKNIRYVSVGERHEFTPHPPAAIFKNRYGDCKDGAQFLAAMLKAVGIPSASVSLNTRGDWQILERLPTPAADHAILLVTIDGVEHWIDTTYSFGEWDFLPPADSDRVCFVVDDKDIRLMRTPRFRAEANRTEMETDIELTAKGSGYATRRVSYFGLAAIGGRDAWVGVPSGERRKGISGGLQEAIPCAKLRCFNIDEASLDNLTSPVRMKMEFDIPEFLKGDPGTGMSGELIESLVWSNLLGVTIDLERTQPLELSNPWVLQHRFHFRAPLGYRLINHPKSESIASPTMEFSRVVEVEREGRSMSITFTAKLLEKRIGVPEAFKKEQEFVQNSHRFSIFLTAADDSNGLADDCKILEAMSRFRPDDTEGTATYIRYALSHGRKTEAASALQTALALHPESAELLELLPMAANNAQEFEAASRKLIKQFPKEPSYRIVLAHRLLQEKQYKKVDELLEPERRQSGSRAADAYMLTAYLFMEQQSSKKAEEAFDAAVKADASITNNREAAILEGQIQEMRNHPERAETAYLKALRYGEDCRVLEGLLRIVTAEKRAWPTYSPTPRSPLSLMLQTQSLPAFAPLPPPQSLPAFAPLPPPPVVGPVYILPAGLPEGSGVPPPAPVAVPMMTAGSSPSFFPPPPLSGPRISPIVLAPGPFVDAASLPSTTEPERAYAYLQCYIALAERDPSLQLKAATFAWYMNRPEAASDLLGKVLAGGSVSMEAHKLAGLIAARKEDWELAARELEKAEWTRTDFESLQIWLEAELMVGQPQKLTGKKGLAALEKTSKRPPADEQAWLKKRSEQLGANPSASALTAAEYLFQIGRGPDQVEKPLALAFQDKTESGPALALRAALEVKRGQLRKGLADAEKAIKLAPRMSGYAYYARGIIRLERNESGALEDMKKAVELTDHRDARVLLGLAAAMGQDRENARKALNEAGNLHTVDAEIADLRRELGL